MQLLAIEKELAGADGEAAMKRYDDILVALGQRLTQELQQGLAPDDYASAEKLGEAVVVARKLLRLSLRESWQGREEQ